MIEKSTHPLLALQCRRTLSNVRKAGLILPRNYRPRVEYCRLTRLVLRELEDNKQEAKNELKELDLENTR